MFSPIARRLALIGACIGLAATSLAHADPLPIRAGWVAAPASLLPVLFAKPGIARHQGSSYQLEPTYFSASPTMITALASGELEIAALGYSTMSLAILNARVDDLRVIADEIQDGHPGYYSNSFVVRKDSPIQTVADLKGKVVATNGLGSGVDIAMRTMLLKSGLRDKNGYTTVEVSFPNMKATLLEGKADLVTNTLPFSYAPDMIAASRVLFHQRDALGASELSFWTSRAGFLQKNRAAMVDFMEDFVRALHWYFDPANRTEAIAIIARFTKQPPERFTDWLFTKGDYYRDPNGVPDLDALARNIRAQFELGLLRADIDPQKYADLSLLREAIARVGANR